MVSEEGWRAWVGMLIPDSRGRNIYLILDMILYDLVGGFYYTLRSSLLCTRPKQAASGAFPPQTQPCISRTQAPMSGSSAQGAG